MTFFFEQWTPLRNAGVKEGAFITNEEGKVIFIGGPGAGGGTGTGGGNAIDVGGIKISTQDPSIMRGAQITKEQGTLDKISLQLNDQMLSTGRGSERPSERRGKSDMLSLQINATEDRLFQLRNEVQQRAGPSFSRLPAGVGGKPRKAA